MPHFWVLRCWEIGDTEVGRLLLGLSEILLCIIGRLETGLSFLHHHGGRYGHNTLKEHLLCVITTIAIGQLYRLYMGYW